jgi:hypothetical protein
MAIWSIWEDENGNVSLNQGDGPLRGLSGAVIAPTDRLVKTFEAETFDEAILKKNWYYGWEPSSPMGDATAPRDVDRLVAACRKAVGESVPYVTAWEFDDYTYPCTDPQKIHAEIVAALAAIDGPGGKEGESR